MNVLAGLFAMLLGLACLALAHAAAERHDIRKRQTPVEIGPAPLDYVPSEPRKPTTDKLSDSEILIAKTRGKK